MELGIKSGGEACGSSLAGWPNTLAVLALSAARPFLA